MRGPNPERSEFRRRTNSPSADRGPNRLSKKIGPELPKEYGIKGIGAAWYESLRTSGQAVYYTSSDWTSAWLIAKAIHDYENNARDHGRGSLLAGILKGMNQLMVTEGDRRSARLELERSDQLSEDAAEDAGAASISRYREKLAEAQTNGNVVERQVM